MIRSYFLLILLLSGGNRIAAQDTHSEMHFLPPVCIPIQLSGTFGELRSDHFHSGIDIRTESREGLPVIAIAGGEVVRINVSGTGYGKALYISHPDGHLSVYAHLRDFSEGVGKYVKQEQYRRKVFALECYPAAGTFEVRRGDTIGWSGNTGSSGGPHLHFEIRDAVTGKPLNPLLFGFNVEDHNAPLINMIRIYPAHPFSEVNHQRAPADIYMIWDPGNYHPKGTDTVKVMGPVYFGLNTWDPFNAGNNKNGVFSVEYLIDDHLWYSHRMEAFSFDETRYINSLIDYGEFVRNRRHIQRTRIDPANRLSIYRHIADQGVYYSGDSLLHLIEIRVSDIAGNTSTAKLILQSMGSFDPGDPPQPDSLAVVFHPGSSNSFRNDDIRVDIPEGALYDTIHFVCITGESKPGMLSPLIHVHHPETPLHRSFRLAIRPDSIIANPSLMVMVRFGENKEHGIPGIWMNGMLEANVREFGIYGIREDSLAPSITPLNIRKSTSGFIPDTLIFKVNDDLSGIKNYQAEINGVWVLLEYDPKTERMYYGVDDHLVGGKNEMVILVNDHCGNEGRMEITIDR